MDLRAPLVVCNYECLKFKYVFKIYVIINIIDNFQTHKACQIQNHYSYKSHTILHSADVPNQDGCV